MKPSHKEPVELAERLRAEADGIVTDIKAYGIPEDNPNTKIINDKLREEAKLLYDSAAALESSAAWKKDAMEKVEAEIGKIPEYDQTKKMDAGEYYDLGKLGALEWVRDEILTSTPTAESKASEK